jgi:alkanesulfonate monooxygenase SsuD/methylene tetrahydromethanopterin reductase-like flavin-dependent oxidoreductase (luciferase family)
LEPPESFLDLGIVVEGQDIPDALKEFVHNAQYIELLGYKRIWVAEHHNTASAYHKSFIKKLMN